MNDVLFSPEAGIALLGAIAGTFATIIIQYIVHRRRLFMAYKRFRHDIRNLDRHVSASLSSLQIDPGAPRYLVAARLRFCKFMDGMRSIEQLEWLTQRKDSDRILPTLLAIRNSDTFMEEVACRVDGMSQEELAKALEEARTNMRFLGKVSTKLGYKTTSQADYSVPVDDILAELRTTGHTRVNSKQG
ncbi:MAG: hypothetical protein AAFR73_10015 [Pseudomonadota bacterium]